MMNQEGDKRLSLAPIPKDLLAIEPNRFIHSISEFNRSAFDFLKTEKLLKDINQWLFHEKGTIQKPHEFFGVDTNGPKKKTKQSRFDTYFSAQGDLRYTSLRTALTIKKSDLPIPIEGKPFDSLNINITCSVYPQTNSFIISTSGDIYFVKTRWIDCGMNWGPQYGDKKSFYLRETGESRSIEFMLNNPPQAKEIMTALTRNLRQILVGMEDQGFLKIPKETPPTPPTTPLAVIE